MYSDNSWFACFSLISPAATAEASLWVDWGSKHELLDANGFLGSQAPSSCSKGYGRYWLGPLLPRLILRSFQTSTLTQYSPSHAVACGAQLSRHTTPALGFCLCSAYTADWLVEAPGRPSCGYWDILNQGSALLRQAFRSPWVRHVRFLKIDPHLGQLMVWKNTRHVLLVILV